MHIVYKTTNLLNGRYYIGMQNTNDESYLGSGLALVKAVKKYGRENFIKEILVKCETREETIKKESELITEDTLSDPLSYNLKPGGLGGSRKGLKRPKRSKEYIKKQSEAKKGINNPRHYTLWTTPWGVFESLNQAANACPDYITGNAIKLFCLNKNSKVVNTLSVARSKGYLKSEHIGFTYRELGFQVTLDKK